MFNAALFRKFLQVRCCPAKWRRAKGEHLWELRLDALMPVEGMAYHAF
jgi:hypothetical protein